MQPVTEVVTDLDVLIQGYSSYLAAINKAARTVQEYTKDVTRWARWWKRPPEFFGQDEWDDWVLHLRNTGVSACSANRYRSSLKRFFRYLRRRKLATHDPSYDSERPKAEKRIPVVLTQEEVPLLRRRLRSPRTQAIFALLYDCGLRNEEARNLTVERITPSSIHVSGKGAKDRVITIVPATYQVLAHWIEVKPPGTHLFLTISGNVIDEPAVNKMVARISKGARIQKRVTPHTLRHSIATHLIENGMTMEQLQVFLGHESIETTRKYVHLAQQLIKKAVLKAHPMA